MKNIFIKSMTVLTLLMVVLCGVNKGKTEAASKQANQDLIIINKYYNKLAYFHNGYIEIVDPVATGKTWDKTPVGFFKVVNKIKNPSLLYRTYSWGRSSQSIRKTLVRDKCKRYIW